jgi:hypothetical protein
LRNRRQEDEQPRIAAKPIPIGEVMRIECEQLLLPAAEGFELAKTNFSTVDNTGCMEGSTNFYSTPSKPEKPGSEIGNVVG